MWIFWHSNLKKDRRHSDPKSPVIIPVVIKYLDFFHSIFEFALPIRRVNVEINLLDVFLSIGF